MEVDSGKWISEVFYLAPERSEKLIFTVPLRSQTDTLVKSCLTKNIKELNLAAVSLDGMSRDIHFPEKLIGDSSYIFTSDSRALPERCTEAFGQPVATKFDEKLTTFPDLERALHELTFESKRLERKR